MSEALKPMELFHELYDRRLNRISPRTERNEAALRRRFALLKGMGRLLKPLLRFENLLPLHQRIGLELIASESMTTDLLWALWPINTALKKYLENSFRAVETGDPPVAWLEWCISTDLILAFEAQPMCTEGLVALLLLLDAESNIMINDIGEEAGVPVEYCSASKNAVGACLSGQLPPPRCIVTSSHPCDSIVSSYQSIEYLTGAPTFRLDTPFWDDERSVDYYAGEIRRLIAFLEEQFKRKLDYDRLREVLTEVNRTNELMMEINEMYRVKPCPGTIVSTVLEWVGRVIGIGTPEITEASRRLHHITRQNVEAGRGTIKNEKIRVIWFDVPIPFYPLVVWMEETFGAVIVTDVTTYMDTPMIDTSTEDTMVRGLASSYMNLAMARQFHGPVEYYTRDLERICEEYNGDCFIFAGHQGCKHSHASLRILKEYMKKIDMPLLILSCDIFDRRVTHEDKLKAQIEEFFISNGLA